MKSFFVKVTSELPALPLTFIIKQALNKISPDRLSFERLSGEIVIVTLCDKEN